MLTINEMEMIRNSNFNMDDFIRGPMRLEDIEGYFRRELKENLLEQGWALPEELVDPDEDNAPIPDYLRERPDPDIRSRYDGVYDGGEDVELPHYGTPLYWQWEEVNRGKLRYLKVYNPDGEEIKIPRRMYGELITQIRDVLLSRALNPIVNFRKGYQWFCIGKEDLDIEDMDMVAFVTIYLF